MLTTGHGSESCTYYVNPELYFLLVLNLLRGKLIQGVKFWVRVWVRQVSFTKLQVSCKFCRASCLLHSNCVLCTLLCLVPRLCAASVLSWFQTGLCGLETLSTIFVLKLPQQLHFSKFIWWGMPQIPLAGACLCMLVHACATGLIGPHSNFRPWAHLYLCF